MPAGDGAPHNDRESLGSLPVVSRVSCLLMNARLPSDFCGARISSAPPPPSPFPRTTVLVPIPSRPTGEYFRGLPARPLSVGSPWPRTLRPPNRCPGPRPVPPSPFLRHARGSLAPSPKHAFSSDHAVRDNPAPRARERARLPRLLRAGPNICLLFPVI